MKIARVPNVFAGFFIASVAIVASSELMAQQLGQCVDGSTKVPNASGGFYYGWQCNNSGGNAIPCTSDAVGQCLPWSLKGASQKKWNTNFTLGTCITCDVVSSTCPVCPSNGAQYCASGTKYPNLADCTANTNGVQCWAFNTGC